MKKDVLFVVFFLIHAFPFQCTCSTDFSMVHPLLYWCFHHHYHRRSHSGKRFYRFLYCKLRTGDEMAGKILHCNGNVCHRIKYQPYYSGEKGWQTDCYGLYLLGDDFHCIYCDSAGNRYLFYKSVTDSLIRWYFVNHPLSKSNGLPASQIS